MANLDNYLILVFIVVTGILIAIQFAGERFADWLTDLTQQFFSKSLDKHEEKRKAEREKNKLRSYSLVILPDKTKIIFSYSNLRYLTQKNQYLYLTNNRKETAHF